MEKMYVLTLSTGESYGFTSEQKRKDWMGCMFKQMMTLAGGYFKGVTFKMFWEHAILSEVTVIS